MKKLYHLFLTFALLSAAASNDYLDPDAIELLYN